MSVNKLNRREFIKASTVGVIGAAMAAAGASTDFAISTAEKAKDLSTRQPRPWMKNCIRFITKLPN